MCDDTLSRDCVTSPSMVRQAHHERTATRLEITSLAVHPEPRPLGSEVEGGTANCDTVSYEGRESALAESPRCPLWEIGEIVRFPVAVIGVG